MLSESRVFESVCDPVSLDEKKEDEKKKKMDEADGKEERAKSQERMVRYTAWW